MKLITHNPLIGYCTAGYLYGKFKLKKKFKNQAINAAFVMKEIEYIGICKLFFLFVRINKH